LTNDRRKALELWLQSAATEPGSATVASGVSPDNMEIELDELLLAPTDADARAVREQLVRFGQAALPAVYQRLKAAPNDTARQRLTALRYRLVATDRLAAEWPGGFDRLASADPFVRRAATDELAQHVTADDLRLLVELFGDKDEFVRERSLKILRAVGGPETNKALMKLLQDPDSNVRAAVLKTLAEAPDPALAPDLVRYAASENDADLVVHTIHVLQDIPGETSANGLKDLLSHPQWRVRAEACEAIHQKLQSHEQMSPAQAAVLISGLSKCLNDTDQFVVSQAAAALIAFHLSPADKAVMQAIDRNPELAVALLAGIARDRDSAVMLLPAIRKLTSNPEPQIRASAIGAICEFDPRSAGPALSAGLKDQDASVRQAAANGLVTVLDEISPQDGVIFLEPGNYQTAQTNVDGQQWATAFMTGNGRPSWMPPLKPDLERLLKDSDEPTRVAAAVSLCALGHANEAWPVLAASSSSEIARATEATALPFLDWDQRKTLFDRLVAITPDGQMHRLIDKFATIPDPRAAPELWNLLRDPPREALLSDVNSAMSKIYELNGLGGSSLFGSMVSAMFSAKPSPVKDATAMLQTGHDLQKTEALSLLYAAAPDAVAKPAKEIFQDHHNSPGLRNDALQVLLVSLPDQEAQAAAASALSDAAIRKTAACYLAVGGEAITALRGDVYLQSHSTSVVQYEFGQQPEPIIHVNAPAGLQVAQVSDLLNDPDQDLAGYAGYLAAVLGDHNGLVPLLKAARAHDFDVSSWGRLVYRAIAKLDDDSQTPVLEEVYKSFAQEPWAMREFYWTIRSMHGPNILKLRKKIRDEVGMAQLQ
jgi:HEAT repeat protein